MRYYSITVVNQQTQQPIKGADGTAFGPWTSLLPAANGSVFALGGNNPGALRVKFDIPVSTFDLPISGAYVRLYGIPLPTLYQAAQFNPSQNWENWCSIKISAGMSKGLPLANPNQAGPITVGSILQAFGNWQGTEQTIDFMIGPSAGTSGNFGTQGVPKNIVFNWTDGQMLGDAVKNTLTTAFPGAIISGADKLNASLSLPYQPQYGQYQTMAQFSEAITGISQDIVNGTDGPTGYPGIKIVPTDTGFQLFDGTTTGTPTQIQFTDLIGQPVWLSPYQLTFKCVMRNDLMVGGYITMPKVPTPTTTTSQSYSQYRNKATFQGTFQISSLRHLGDSRQPSADAWVTVVECFSDQAA
jgi:hypothetical protein